MRLRASALLLLSFAGLIAIGTLLLCLPVAAASGSSAGFVDALFTSTSAVCVTGLVTVDTATQWSAFGQGVILCLIQLGGLGILTFSTLIALLLGSRISLSHHEIVTSGVAPLQRVDVFRVLRRIVVITGCVELVGALVLWGAFSGRFGGGEAAWHAVFHSVSAFCNAGFSTFSDSLVGYRADVLVNVTIMALIVLGGIGFVVFMDIENRIRFRDRLGLHTKIVLVTTAILIVVGAIGFYLCEAGNSLKGVAPGEQVLVSLFASVTARTAGFNTLDYSVVTTPALMLTMMLMFVGGSPGSCAGGLKTTTLAVMFASARAALTGRPSVDLFRRTVQDVAVRQAQVLSLIGLGMMVVLPLGLEFTEAWAMPFRQSAERYFELGFEVVSALGTVGLSTGITSTFTAGGKLLLVLLMYAGRLGLLTLGMAIARRRSVSFRYAEESVIIG